MNTFNDKLFEVVKDVAEVKTELDDINIGGNGNSSINGIKNAHMTLNEGNTYVILTEKVVGHTFKGIVSYNSGYDYVDVSLGKDEYDDWRAIGAFAKDPSILREVDLTFVFVTIDDGQSPDKEYLALKVYLESYGSSGLNVWCINSTNPDIFELRTDEVTEGSEVNASWVAPYVDKNEFEALETKTVLSGKIARGSKGSKGPNKNPSFEILASMKNDNTVHQFNMKVGIVDAETTKLLGEIILNGCTYNMDYVILYSNVHYTADNDCFEFLVGKQGNMIGVVPKFTKDKNMIETWFEGYRFGTISGTLYSEESFEAIDISAVDLTSRLKELETTLQEKITALEERITALEGA